MKNTALAILLMFVFLTSCTENRSNLEFSKEIENLINQETINISKAKKASNAFLKKYPKNSDAYLYKGIIELMQKDSANAMISFKKSIELLPSNYRTYIERAKFKVQAGDSKGASFDIQTAEHINRKNADIYVVKGTIDEQLNQFDNAINAYIDAIALGKKDAKVEYRLGCLYLGKGDMVNAYNHLSESGNMGNMEAFQKIRSNFK
jgi:tetratricopeptide (TPR) repeat protein